MEETEQIQPRKSWFKKLLKFLTWCLAIVFLVLGSGIALVFVYEDEVKGIVIKELNKHLATEVRIDPKNIDLTFISSFPRCAIEFKNLTAMEAVNTKERDTLLFAGNLSLKFSLKDVFNKKYNITRISMEDARCYLKVNKQGVPNYEAWKSSGNETNLPGDSLSFRLEDIILKNVSISYRNSHQKIKTDFTVTQVAFSGNFSELNYEMHAKGKINIGSVTSGKTTFVKHKKLSLDIILAVKGNQFMLEKTDISLNQMMFDITGAFRFKDSLQDLRLKYKARNLDIESVLSLLPEKNKTHIKDYKSDGEFFVAGNLDYTAGRPMNLETEFGIKNATIEYVPGKAKLTNVVVAGELTWNNSVSFIRLRDFDASLNGDKINGKFYLENFSDPKVEVSARGGFNLKNLYSFLPLDTLQSLEGALRFSGEIKGSLKDLRESTFSDKVNMALEIQVEKLKALFKNDKHEIAIESCKIAARDRDIRVEDFKLIRGSSDVSITGEIPGLFNYFLDSNGSLVVKGALQSNNLLMEDFIFSAGNSSSHEEFNIPANINLVLDASVDHFTFGKFEAHRIRGNFELKKQKAMVSDMRLETMEGEATINAYADASGRDLEITLESEIKKLNVKKLFYQVNNFGQTTLLDKNIKGIVSAQLNFKGSWNKKLEPQMNTILATSGFTIEQGELVDFSPLESLARFVELQELKRIKFLTLTSNLEIKNSAIYIPQTSIKNSALNIDFNGTHTFNNEIDYHIRLLISDLLAKKRKADDEFGPVENDPDNHRSAFILMTGSIDNPVFKYDKKGLKQKIKEDIKQEKQNLKQLLKEEFGVFKKDSVRGKPGNKADQKFELEKPGNNQPKKTLEPRKKNEDDDDF